MIPQPRRTPKAELEELRLRLEEAEQTIRAIRSGDVDALVVDGPSGPRVYALEGASNSYRALVETMSEGAATLTRAGTVLYCNRRFADMLGFPLEKVMGGALRAHVSSDERDAFDALLRGGWAGTSKGEFTLQAPDGGVLKVHLSLSALVDREPVLCLVATDLTDHIRAQELRESERRAVIRAAEFEALLADRGRSEEALREADRRKDDFLGVLSHELRNPLAPIINALYILDHADPVGEHAREAKVVLARQVSHLGRLVDDLLDATRISHGKIQLQRGRVELGELVRRVVEDHRSGFAARDIEVTLRLEARPLCLDGDAARITQVIGNLLQNAAKFTNANGHVVVAVEREGATASVRVTDDGAGMDAETLLHVFEPFRQADRTLHRSLGGLGLGLALVKGLVEQHGGRVEARSDGVGHGSEVTVWLPVGAEILLQLEPPHTHGAPLAQRRVLIIEDNVDFAETLRLILEMQGQSVEVAHDGREGVAKTRALRPDIVFCDIGLPELDGYEVARQIRSDRDHMPTLIALTGYARPDDRRKAVEAGFDHHVCKPIQIAQIQDLLARVERSVH